MKLLFDENLSPKLARLVGPEFSGSVHVRDVGLLGASDRRIWDYAYENGFIIVSKDDDFRQRSFLEGPPPKVVWLQVGNAGTGQIAELLQERSERLRNFADENESAILIVSPPRRAV